MGRTEETLEEAYEMLGIVAQPIANPALGGADDEALLAELDQLTEAQIEAELGAELTSVHPPSSSAVGEPSSQVNLPNAPNTMMQAISWDEERELAELNELAASMNWLWRNRCQRSVR